MIALNELLKDIDAYDAAYKLMGQNNNLKTFVKLEKRLRDAGQTHDNSRALCNKKCGELIKKQAENQDTTSELEEIIKLDKQTLKLQTKYNKFNKNINKKLRKLSNFPENNNISHLQIETKNTVSTIEDFKSFIEKTCKPSTSSMTVDAFAKNETEKLFEESSLPQITYCKDGIVALVTKDALKNTLDSYLEYLKNNSISIVELSIKKLKNSSAQEFLIHLNKNLYLKLELKREFLTREYKIKYRDTSTDMTKFVNQINILF